jgi:hypothetical protein
MKHRDFEAFCKNLPYDLIPTSIPGVLSLPPISEKLDPWKASRTDLVKNGFFWPGPKSSHRATQTAAWKKVFSRPWLASGHIIPRMQVKKTPRVAHLLKRMEEADTSSNWSGCFVEGEWNCVFAIWEIPTVSAGIYSLSPTWYSASWVGIDGAFNASNDVLQAGVAQNVAGDGQASYMAWYEWFAPPVENSPPYIDPVYLLDFGAVPGDTVFCLIQYLGPYAAFVGLGNFRNGAYCRFILEKPPGASFNGSSVEWIMECPTGVTATYAHSAGSEGSGSGSGGSVSSTGLPKFTPVQFTHAGGFGPSDASADPFNGQTVNIVDPLKLNEKLTSVAVGHGTVTITYDPLFS